MKTRKIIRRSIFTICAFLCLMSFSAVAHASRITSPAPNSYVRGEVEITGTADIKNFDHYEIYYAAKKNPDATHPIYTSHTAVTEQGDLLDGALWNTAELNADETPGIPDSEYILSLTTVDVRGNKKTYSVPIIVDNYNNKPVINLSNKGAVIGVPLKFKVGASDLDDPETPDGQFEYYAHELPPGAQFNNQIFSWTPQESDKGNYKVIFQAVDGGGITASRSINIYTLYVDERRISDRYHGTIPCIYEDKVVWSAENENADYDVFLYNLFTGKKSIQFTTDWLGIGDFCGSKLVGTRWSQGGRDDIWMYDINTGKETRITAHSGLQRGGAIYGNDIDGYTIVWLDIRAHPYDKHDNMYNIYMYDTNDRKIRPITKNNNKGELADFPRIHGDIVVWNHAHESQTKYGFDHDIYKYEEGKSGVLLASPKISGCGPAVFGERIAWAEDPDPGLDRSNWEIPCSNGDIYMADIHNTKNKKLIWKGPYEKVIYESPGKVKRGRTFVTGLGLSDDNVVWGKEPYCWSSSMYLYNFLLGTVFEINKDTPYVISPKTYKDGLVFCIQDKSYFADKNRYKIYAARLFFVPQVKSVTPAELSLGSTITIKGNFFGHHPHEYSYVEFGGGGKAYSDACSKWTDTEIVLKARRGAAASGPVEVATLGGRSEGAEIKVIRRLGDGRYYEYMEWYPNGKAKVMELHAENGELLVTFTYYRDALGNGYQGKKLEYTSGNVRLREYNAQNKLTKLGRENKNYIVYTHTADGKVKTVKYYRGVNNKYKNGTLLLSVTRHYDAAGKYLGKKLDYWNGIIRYYDADNNRINKPIW